MPAHDVDTQKERTNKTMGDILAQRLASIRSTPCESDPMKDFPATDKYRDQVADGYDEARNQKSTTHKDQAAVENYLGKLSHGDSVLDVPAGTGRFIQFCISCGLIYTGVDLSHDMLEVARTKIPAGGVTNIELRVADARALPFENDAFDYAICIKFIKWLPNMKLLIEVLREIARVTRKEMFVQIKVVKKSPHSLATRVGRLVGRLPAIGAALATRSKKSKGGSARGFSEQELAVAFSAAGLHIRSVVPNRVKKRSSRNTRPVTNFYVLSKEPRHGNVPHESGKLLSVDFSIMEGARRMVARVLKRLRKLKGRGQKAPGKRA
jgi:ubiquinone/menaquinone biosynthesis C-methylase UbiE